jgi:hypothetical protein
VYVAASARSWLSGGRSRLFEGAIVVPRTFWLVVQPVERLRVYAFVVFVASATSTLSAAVRPNVGLPQMRNESSSVCIGPDSESPDGN